MPNGPTLLAAGVLLAALTAPPTAAADHDDRRVAFAAGVALGSVFDEPAIRRVHGVHRHPFRVHPHGARVWRHGYPPLTRHSHLGAHRFGAMRWYHGGGQTRQHHRFDRHIDRHIARHGDRCNARHDHGHDHRRDDRRHHNGRGRHH